MKWRAFVIVLIGGTLPLSMSCGGGGSPTGPPPGPSQTPTPAPTPAPTPTPTPCTVGLCEDPTTNTAAALRCTGRLYWTKRPGTNEIILCDETEIPEKYPFAVDWTCKDKDNKPTNSTSRTSYRWDGTDRFLECNDHGPFQLWCVGIEIGHFQNQIVVENASGPPTRGFWFHGDIVPEAESKCAKK